MRTLNGGCSIQGYHHTFHLVLYSDPPPRQVKVLNLFRPITDANRLAERRPWTGHSTLAADAIAPTSGNVKYAPLKRLLRGASQLIACTRPPRLK